MLDVLIDGDGDRWELFKDPVPSKGATVDYKKVVKNPICLKQIMKKLRRPDAYQGLVMFQLDMQLLVDNAQLYNGVCLLAPSSR